jgi:hypothetical protein
MAAAFGAAIMLRGLHRLSGIVYRLLLGLVLLVGLIYPVYGLFEKTRNLDLEQGIFIYRACRQDFMQQDCFKKAVSATFDAWGNWTLDGAAHLDIENPDDAAAIRFLQGVPFGVVAEATLQASYNYNGRISTHTGLPTVLGWPGHESQWRGGHETQGTRMEDMRTLYEAQDWETTRMILERYDIRYVVVGNLERVTYIVNEAKFSGFLREIFRSGSLVIYQVP